MCFIVEFYVVRREQCDAEKHIEVSPLLYYFKHFCNVTLLQGLTYVSVYLYIYLYTVC